MLAIWIARQLHRPLQAIKRAVLASFTADQIMTSGASALPQAHALVPFGPGLLTMERQPQQHTPFARDACLPCRRLRSSTCA